MLTTKQSAFVREYLVDLNATQAAIRAGYSPDTAESQGSRLLRNVKVSNEVKKNKKLIEDESKITKEMVINELARGAFSAIPLDEIKFSDKIKCLELLCKYFGLLDGKNTDSTENSKISMDRISNALKNLGIGSRNEVN